MGYLIQNALIINEGKRFTGCIKIQGKLIESVYEGVPRPEDKAQGCTIIDASGKWVIPGAIDDQVHFREPGLTHKGDLYTEPKAAVAGGITSFMEMPNTRPSATTQDLLAAKYVIAAEKSLANYSFFIGASNSNLEDVLLTDPKNVCGVKVFMGSSTGDLLVDNQTALENLFRECKLLIALHCEDDLMIKQNAENHKKIYGENIPPEFHPVIRNEEACYKSSSLAVELATKYNTRIHILHISTAKELSLFRNDIPSTEKRITSEACVHHLWFSDEDYKTKKNLIKWNPAVKKASDRAAIQQAVIDGRIDVLATDHAPHTLEEKNRPYFSSPSGGPLVQHALPALFELAAKGIFTPELIVQRYCHAPADLFKIEKRGYLRPGYYADIVILDPESSFRVSVDNLLYKCQWSPFEGTSFRTSIHKTFVNGHLVYDQGNFNETERGMRLSFNR